MYNFLSNRIVTLSAFHLCNYFSLISGCQTKFNTSSTSILAIYQKLLTPFIILRAFSARNAMPFTCSDIFKTICSVILPPIGVFAERGCNVELFICILLTILGYFPGLIYAIFIICKYWSHHSLACEGHQWNLGIDMADYYESTYGYFSISFGLL